MVHRREWEGAELVLGNQGDLLGNAMTWWDHDTGSVWSQPTGEAILGPLSGARLELLPSTLTSWGVWRAAHPETTALDEPGGPSGFDVDEMLIAVDLGDESLAVAVTVLRERGVVNATVNGVPLALAAEVSPGGWWGVYSRRLDDRDVVLERQAGMLVEVGGDGRWTLERGLARDGGQRLDPLGALTVLPGDFPVPGSFPRRSCLGHW